MWEHCLTLPVSPVETQRRERGGNVHNTVQVVYWPHIPLWGLTPSASCCTCTLHMGPIQVQHKPPCSTGLACAITRLLAAVQTKDKVEGVCGGCTVWQGFYEPLHRWQPGLLKDSAFMHAVLRYPRATPPQLVTSGDQFVAGDQPADPSD